MGSSLAWHGMQRRVALLCKQPSDTGHAQCRPKQLNQSVLPCHCHTVDVSARAGQCDGWPCPPQHADALGLSCYEIVCHNPGPRIPLSSCFGGQADACDAADQRRQLQRGCLVPTSNHCVVGALQVVHDLARIKDDGIRKPVYTSTTGWSLQRPVTLGSDLMRADACAGTGCKGKEGTAIVPQ